MCTGARPSGHPVCRMGSRYVVSLVPTPYPPTVKQHTPGGNRPRAFTREARIAGSSLSSDIDRFSSLPRSEQNAALR